MSPEPGFHFLRGAQTGAQVVAAAPLARLWTKSRRREGCLPVERLSQDPRAPEFQASPWSFYERARARGDFVFWEELGMPVAVTDAAVEATLKHRRLGRARPGGPHVPDGMPAFAGVERHSLLELEPPDHTRLRGAILRAFTSSRIAALAPDISRVTDELIAAVPDAGPFDLIGTVAQPLPVRVIAKLLGVPCERWRELLDWSNAMVAMYQARRDAEVECAAEAAAAEFTAFIRDVIAHKRRAPADDLVSALANAAPDTVMSDDEIVSTVILLLNAGHEATVHAIGNTLHQLLRYDRRAEALSTDMIEATIEEGIRVRPPLHLFTRHVYEPVEILGTRLGSGTEVGACLGSACHDDAVWANPERFDPFRRLRRNMAFGAGIHFCVGAPLARLELSIAMQALFDRFPKLALSEPPEHANAYHFHGLRSLKVTR